MAERSEIVEFEESFAGLERLIVGHIFREMQAGRCDVANARGWMAALMLNVISLVAAYLIGEVLTVPNTEKERVLRELIDLIVEKIRSESRLILGGDCDVEGGERVGEGEAGDVGGGGGVGSVGEGSREE